MIGAKLRQRLAAGEHLLMINPNHVSSGLAGRLTELKADAIFIDCEHGTASFDEAREMARAARSGGGGAILRPDSHQRSLLTRYLNAGVDGLMVPLVNTAEQARAVVATVRHACPADFEKKLLICMVETVEAVGNLDEILAVEGVDVFFVGPGDLSQSMGFLPSVPRGQPRPREVLDLVEFDAGAHPRCRQDCRHPGDRGGYRALVALRGPAPLLPYRPVPARQDRGDA